MAPVGTTNDAGRRRALRIAALAAATVWFLVIALWEEGPFALTFDDAYYYFGIARNIVDGYGSSFDRINLTNGYHPLWMVVCLVPYAAGLDDLVAARVLLLVQVVAWGATGWLVADLITDVDETTTPPGDRPVAGLARRATGLLAAVLFLAWANPYIVKAAVNGLESGLVAPIHAVLLLRVTRQFRRTGTASLLAASSRWRWVTGLVLALAFLVRTDAGLLTVALGLWWAADTFVGGRRKPPWTSELRAAAELFAPTAVAGVLFLIVNQALFGSPMQISGSVKRVALDAGVVVVFVLFLAAALAIGRHGWRRTHGTRAKRPQKFPRAAAFVLPTSWYAGFCVVLIAYYNVLQTQQWLWYYAPLVLYAVVVFVLAVGDILAVAVTPEKGEALDEATAARRMLAVGGLVFVLPLAAGLVYQSIAFADPTIRSIQLANRDAGEWIRANVPEDEVLASWDAGVVGYFAHRRVVNLDGVVNSAEYHDARLAGDDARFLRCQRVGWIVNHGAPVDGGDPDIVAYVDRLYGPGALADPAVVHRVPFRYSGTTVESGFELAGEREMVVHLYRIDPAIVGPRPDDRCPA